MTRGQAAQSRQMNWLPEHIREGRFGNFLESNVDWALSRERYWGTPLPIWVCEQTGRMEAVASYDTLKAEAEAAFAHYGRDAFRVEFLRRVCAEAQPPATSWIPFYEQVGEARVREGRYRSVLRYEANVKPVIERLLTLSPGSHADALYTLHE